MRLEIALFFLAGSAGVLSDDFVLDCYRLADHYHQPPDVFLAMTAGEIRLHMRRTVELMRQKRAAEGDDS